MNFTWKRSTFCASGTCVEVAWTTSSFCANGACVQIGWQRSTRCSSGGCVEVGHEDGRVLLRDSKRGDESPVIEFTPSGWRVFLTVAQEWDRKSAVSVSGVTLDSRDEEYAVRISVHHGFSAYVHLHFTWDEWDAFVKGVDAGEFDPEVAS